MRQKFDYLVEGPQPPEIIKLGGAVPCRGFTIGGALDLEKLHVRGGDYVDSEMSLQACRPEALEHVVNEWKRLCKDRPTLAIGSTIVQTQKTCETFNQHGISAEVLIGSTPKDERERMFARVRSGQTLILCSVGALRAGFDLPCISAILYVRATKSKALFYQSSGRGSRPAPGKSDYLLLDFGGNLKRFGDPMGYQDYCIDEQPGSDHQAPTKTCSECGAEILAFAQICPECGSQFAGEKDAEAEKSDRLVQLSEWADQFARAKIAKLRQWRRQTFLAGESPDLAVARFVSEFGHTPPLNWMQHACLTRRYSQKRQEAYCNWIFSQCKTNNRWAEQWIRYHLAAEFGIDDRDSLDSWHDVLECYTASWAEVLAAYRSRLRLCSNEGEAAELAEALQ
ncbi:MAG TPA: helicase-related protein, partial [Allocoleopsis sp.]